MDDAILSPLFLRAVRIRREELNPDSYLRELPVVKFVDRMEFHSPVTFFVGENGTGKSTLLEGIAVNCGFNPEGGTKNFSFSTADTHSELCRHITVSKGHRHPKDGFFLRAESFYNVATNIDEMSRSGLGRPVVESYGGVSLHHQSHGESFLSLILNRFGGDGLYLLDEPEAALSPSRLMTLIAAIHALVGRGSQFVIATHSPILMAYPDSELYQFTGEGVRLTPYQETEHFTLAREFLNNPERMLRILLSED